MAIVVAVISAIVTVEATIAVVAAIVLWDSVVMPVLEFIVGLFGIEDEDVIETQVITQRVIEEDVVASNLITKICLEEQKAEIGTIDRLMAYTQVVRNRYSKVFTYADTEFIDGLPDSNLRSIYVDEATIKDIIDNEYGVDCTLLEADLGAIDKEIYVGFRLQEAYGYTPYNNVLPYSGYNYRVTNIDYNFDTDLYDTYIAATEDQTTTVTTTTTVTVTNIDATTDNVNTVVSERTVIIGTQQGEISDVTIEVSNTDEVVPIDTVEDSVDVVVSESTANEVEFATAVLEINSYQPVRYYSVKYYTTNAAEWYYWAYKANSGTYPELDDSDVYLTQLDMLPVITIRNSTININEDKESERYKQSQDMLEYLGLDIDYLTDSIMENPNIANVEDCFIHFGIQPLDTTSKVVSKSLFMIFDYIYSDSGLLQDNDRYTATFREGSFNAALAWASQSRVVVNGVIGNVGHYEHSISGNDLIMKWQAAEEQYVVLTIGTLSSVTFIDRQGLYGTVGKKVGEEGFFIPLSYYFVTKLSPLEQYELFNRSLLISLYAAQVIHLEWYETEAFMDLLGIVAIVITVFSFGYGVYINGLTATLQTALVAMAITVGATMLLKMVMESTDSKFLRALAAVVYVAAMVYGANAMLPTDASALTTAVTLFATTISSASTAISISTEIEMNKLEAEQLTFGQRVEEKEEELDKAKEALTPYMSIEDILEVTQVKAPLAYLEGVDAMMYRAIGVQYEYAKLYDYDAMVGDFYENKLRIGVI